LMYTPAPSRHTRTLSPPMSTTGSSQAQTIGQQPKLNVVTRLAIEGKAKQGQDGASIKMYLRLSVPMDSVAPGSTIPLFPAEENLKILSSQVHPIDSNSVPYNFSSTTCPLLNNAARALGLPARSERSYLSVFGVSASTSSIGSSSRSSNHSNGVSIPPLDDKYTGHILVSGYNVSYVLPKEFPPRFRDEGASFIRMSAAKSRRGSIGEKNNMHFMAAIDLLVPYLSRPPRAPYLISIPIPRCLSNQIKLRIFPPNNTISTSFASLSSAEEDPGTWDLTSEPHVTRTTSLRPSRSNSYADLADDETSDSSTHATGFADGCGIQGTFPSAERIRVRWASPMKSVDVSEGGDGRRRVGVKEVKGEMTCVVLGNGGNNGGGVAMRVEYKGSCKGVWFPGVATMLGMDVGLEAKGSDVCWVPGEEGKWSVSGGTGYTGFDAGANQKADSPRVLVSPSSPSLDSRSLAPMARRHDSSSSNTSTASLLRAPLPASQVVDYSFEGSPSSTPSGTMSSVGSTPFLLNHEGRSRASSVNGVDPNLRPPAVPLTIHLNMNDLLPPSKNVFTFTISGIIIVKARSRPHSTSQTSNTDGEADPVPIVLPKFNVLAADSETTSMIIRNEADGATIEVYNITGDLRDAQTRRTVLQRGGFTRCGSDGGRIALRSISRNSTAPRVNGDHTQENGRLPPSRPRTPNGVGISRQSSAASLASAYLALGPQRRRRDGPLVIPYVSTTVKPLLNGASHPSAYVVCLSLPAPCDVDSEWLEFGLAQTEKKAGRQIGVPPLVEIVSASINGVPVRFEISAAEKDAREANGSVDLGMPFDDMSGNKWNSWIRVHVGELGGEVEVVYIVKEDASTSPNAKRKGKGKAKDDELDILLPTFALSVRRMEVNAEASLDLDIPSLNSNLAEHRKTPEGYRLSHYAMDELFDPRLSLT
ncbi:hypothetical protein SERLA73DRAFT_19786, partial [Serpula lacrymans var. lacrymans S7.3]